MIKLNVTDWSFVLFRIPEEEDATIRWRIGFAVDKHGYNARHCEVKEGRRRSVVTPTDLHRSIESFMVHKFTMGYIVRVECGVGSIWKWSPVNLISPSISPIMSVIHGSWATGAVLTNSPPTAAGTHTHTRNNCGLMASSAGLLPVLRPPP